MTGSEKSRICFLASGGGHLRQLLQVVPALSQHECVFVTEETALGKSVADQYPTRFVPHFAFGQRKLEGYFKFFISGIANASSSFWHLIRIWPDVIVSTGAGAAFFLLLFGWAFRRKIVYIESIARVTELSLYGKLVRRFAGRFIVQWPELQASVPEAKYCDPLVVHPPTSEPPFGNLFLTIGTFVPFDRMVAAVDQLVRDGKISETVNAQVGDSKLDLTGITAFEACSYEEMQKYQEDSDIVICHGGSGSILGALDSGCRVVAMPRLTEHGEVYDDHQLQIIGALEARGLIEAAKQADDMERAISAARKRPRQRVSVNPDTIAAEVEDFIAA